MKDEHFIVSCDAPGPEIHADIVRRVAELGRSPIAREDGDRWAYPPS
jgi:hypothetical protein